MPLIKLSATLEYFLVNFDSEGHERPEADGTFLTQTILGLLDDPGVIYSDVIIISHGWKGDLPAARQQYDAWLTCVDRDQDGKSLVRSMAPSFHPLIVGLHWPSLPWGDEEVAPAPATLLGSTTHSVVSEQQVEVWTRHLTAASPARAALETILRHAEVASPDGPVTEEVRAAYKQLQHEIGLAGDGATGWLGADDAPFDPDAIIGNARVRIGSENAAEAAAAPSLVLGEGGGSWARDLLLMPLRQLSFWKMKERARHFGEGGAHKILRQIQERSLARKEKTQDERPLRIHLMGHSFGCIVVSAAVAGPSRSPRADMSVDSLFLVQGALSLWAFASDIPEAPKDKGYFYHLTQGIVTGALIATRSQHDRAVGWFYGLGARADGQYLLGDDVSLPLYGGIGTFGIQGLQGVQDRRIGPETERFEARRIYNLDASSVIKNGGGFSGAHSDIMHIEVARAFWMAVASSLPDAEPLVLPSSPWGSVRGDGAGFTGQVGTLGGAGSGRLSERELRRDTPWTGGSSSVGGIDHGGHDARPGELNWVLGPRDSPASSGVDDAFSVGSPFSWTEVTPEPSPPAAVPSPSSVVAEEPPQASRWVNINIEDHPRTAPLRVDRWYTLIVDVDVVARALESENKLSMGISVPLLKGGIPQRPDEIVALTIQISSEDFDTGPVKRELLVGAANQSAEAARFGIAPKHEGLCKIQIVLHREGNFVQQLELTFTAELSSTVSNTAQVEVKVEAAGRAIAAATAIKPRDVSLLMRRTDRGYDCIVWGEVASQATLDINPVYLSEAVSAFRDQMLAVINRRDEKKHPIFQADVMIPPDAASWALKILARAGSNLFKKIFYGPGSGQDAKFVGDYLCRTLGNGENLKFQVVTLGIPIPWACLYLGDASEGAVLDWKNFLGMRHVIEQIPLQPDLTVTGSSIPSNQPRLAVGLNFHLGIDEQMKFDAVGKQVKFWEDAAKARRVTMAQRGTRSELLHSLKDPAIAEQFIYFYCHANSIGLGERGGSDASSITLSDEALVLSDLRLDAPTSLRLAGSPLVFINACESAELSPLFYDGFVPYFMAKGARGVVGTECNTPALFAREWALAFFERFLNGETIGDSFLNLRNHFLNTYNNPLGLLYAVHCDGDTCIAPAPA